MKKKRIVAAIPTYNREEKLKKALRSLRSNAQYVDSAVVFDNMPGSDLEKKLIKDDFYPIKVIYVNSSKNLGSSGGYCEAIKKAYDMGADFVFTMDDDNFIENNFFEKIFSYDEINDKTATAALICSIEGKIQKYHHKKIDRFGEFYSALPKDALYPKDLKEKRYYLDSNAFCGLLIPKIIIEDIGLPDKDYFIWYDDAEYTYRISKKYGLILLTEPKIYHDDDTFIEGRMSKRNLYKSYYGIRNSLLFKFFCVKDPLKKIYIAIRLFSDILRISFYALRKEEDKFLRIKVLFLGFFDGICGRKYKRFSPEDFK